jgi:hypothetical protein
MFTPERRGAAVTASVSVSDPGPGPLQLGGATIDSTAAFSVQADGCAGRILEPDQTCSVGVRFAPLAGGVALGTLRVPSDNGELIVPLAGTSPSVSALTVPAPRLAGPDGVGHSQRLTLAFVNPLTAPVGVASVRLTGGRFRIMADHCAGTELAPGTRCAVVLRFSGTKLGTAHGLLTLTGDGTPLVVPVTATAYPLPAVTDVSSAAGVAVMTSQPSLVKWHVRRIAASHWAKSGRTFTRPRAVVVRGRRQYVARLGLRLAPGIYRVTVTALNGHGVSAPKHLTVTG